MTLKKLTGTTPSRRFATGLTFEEISKTEPEKRLITILPAKAGRDTGGKISVRGRGGREKRFWRKIDFKRDKLDIWARVTAIEYDPNRTANIALLTYQDGEKRYILCPEGLKIGDTVMASLETEIKTGNALPLGKIPVGTPVHNVELVPGCGGQLLRSAGTLATVVAKEEGFVHLKLPSGEIRKIPGVCFATVGQVGNVDWKNIHWGKAGRARHRGKRPKVRGVAQNPSSHPHGGGEGRSGIGMPSPKSPWGKPTLGKKTRKRKKYSDKYILKRRK